MTRQRPSEVTIIVILQLLDGLWGVISGCALLAGGGALAALVLTYAEDAPRWVGSALGGVVVLIGLTLLVFAMLDFVLAWGIGALWRWAWWATMIKAALSILGPLVTLLGGNLTSIPTLILNVAIAALLLSAPVREAFGIR